MAEEEKKSEAKEHNLPEPPKPPTDNQAKKVSEPPKPKDKKKDGPSKLAVFGRLFKDLGKFIFSDDSAAKELERDIATIEKHRSKEKMKEEERKAKEAEEAKRAKEAAEKAKHLKEQEKLKQESLSQKEKLENERKLKMHQKTKEQKKFDKLKQKRAKKLAQEKAKLTAELKAEKDKDIKKSTIAAKPEGAAPPPPPPKAEPKVKAPQPPAAEPKKEEEAPVPKPITKEAPQAPKPDKTKKKKDKKAPKPESDKGKAASKFKKEREKLSQHAAKDDIEKREWQSYKMVSANLIKEQATLFFNWKGRILALIIFVILAVMVNGLIYGGLTIYEEDKVSQNQTLFNNLEVAEKDIKAKEKVIQNEILPLSDKLEFVDYMLSNHIYWTQFFKMLENNTIPEVYYESFAGEIDGIYELPAVATDFSAIRDQITVFDPTFNNYVKSVNSPGGKLQEGDLTPPSSVAQEPSVAGEDDAEAEEEQVEENKYGFTTFKLKLQVDPKIFLK